MISETQREEAAILLAEGRYGAKEIAAKVGMDRVTLWRLRTHDEAFKTRVDVLRKEIVDACKDRAIRRKDYRIETLADVQSRLLQVIEERAKDPTLAEVPGGTSGLIVRQYKISGETCMPEYLVDNGTIRELRAVQEQAAKELGQMVEKHENRVIRSMADLSEDELLAIANADDSGEGAAGAGAPEEAEGSSGDAEG